VGYGILATYTDEIDGTLERFLVVRGKIYKQYTGQ
jgi:hypothetical protein